MERDLKERKGRWLKGTAGARGSGHVSGRGTGGSESPSGLPFGAKNFYLGYTSTLYFKCVSIHCVELLTTSTTSSHIVLTDT